MNMFRVNFCKLKFYHFTISRSHQCRSAFEKMCTQPQILIQLKLRLPYSIIRNNVSQQTQTDYLITFSLEMYMKWRQPTVAWCTRSQNAILLENEIEMHSIYCTLLSTVASTTYILAGRGWTLTTGEEFTEDSQNVDWGLLPYKWVFV